LIEKHAKVSNAPYVLEFLRLEEKVRYSETDLKQEERMDNVRKFGNRETIDNVSRF